LVASSVQFDAIGLIGRVDTASANGTFYYVRYVRDTQVFELFSRVNGSWDWIASSTSYPLANATTYRVALDMTGSTIRVLVDGVEVASAVSTTITAAGRGGFVFGYNGATTLTDTTGYQLDNFRITPPLADSKGTNHGDYLGGPTLGNAGAIAGDANTAALFDGVNDHGTVARQISDDFSIEFWFKSTQGIGTGTAWSQGAGLVDANTSGLNNDFGVCLRSDGVVVAGVGSGGGDMSITSAAGYDDGNWHQVVFTRDKTSGDFKLYVDGAISNSGTSGRRLTQQHGELQLRPASERDQLLRGFPGRDRGLHVDPQRCHRVFALRLSRTCVSDALQGRPSKPTVPPGCTLRRVGRFVAPYRLHRRRPRRPDRHGHGGRRSRQVGCLPFNTDRQRHDRDHRYLRPVHHRSRHRVRSGPPCVLVVRVGGVYRGR
jgi:Concanavalin A-like lectin/glucanases superfamily